MGDTNRRGYGWKHQKLRAALLPQSYGRPCHFCGELMLPGQDLDLDHTEDRSGYRGMSHSACNRRDGARRGNRNRRGVMRNPARRW